MHSYTIVFKLLLLVQLAALFTLEQIQGIKVMELMAPYRIKSIGNEKYLTTIEQGIIGLRTGVVITAPYLGRLAQQWTLAWDPSMDNKHDGYRIESSQEYLNEVTTYYPDGKTRAMPNIWEIIELPEGIRVFKNKRTQKCLQVLKSKPEVVEKTCSIQNRFQHWRLERLDLDKRLRTFLKRY